MESLKLYWKEIAGAIGIIVTTIIIGIIKHFNENKGGSKKITKTESSTPSLDELKRKTHILFIDDEVFKVVNMLKKDGWINITHEKDVASLDADSIMNAHIIFVDIVGVAKKLFKDQGIGLAVALKKRFPKKKIIIYSATRDGNLLFHDGFRIADDLIAKDADHYDFVSTIEGFARQLEL